jgi:hypothetical protein
VACQSSCRAGALPHAGDGQCFEPIHTAPAEAMSLEAIQAALAALFDPALN